MVTYLHLLFAYPGSRSHTDGKWWSKSAAAQTSLLATTTDDGVESDPGPSSNVACADTLGSVDLVARNRHQVDVPFVDINRDLANCLCGIGVEKDLLRSAEPAYLFYWLDNTNLVVDGHDADEHGVGPNGSFELCHVDETIILDGEVCDVEAFVLEMATAVEHALVFCLTCDDVLLLATTTKESGDAFDAHVVALGGAAREDDLLWVGADEVGNALSSILDSLVRLPPVGVCPGVWVTVQTSHEG